MLGYSYVTLREEQRAGIGEARAEGGKPKPGSDDRPCL